MCKDDGGKQMIVLRYYLQSVSIRLMFRGGVTVKGNNVSDAFSM